MVRCLPTVLCAPLVALLAGCGQSTPRASPLPVDAPLLGAADLAGDSLGYLAVLAAEDRRAPTQADRSALLDALASESHGTARAAARALGRLERPELAAPLIEVLRDPAAATYTRAEAANAVAQSMRAGEADSRRQAINTLVTLASEESDPEVFASLVRSVGRIPPADDAQATEVAGALASWGDDSDHGAVGRLGLARAALHHRRATQRGYDDYDPTLLLPLVEGLSTDPDPVVRSVAVAVRRTVSRTSSAAEGQRLLVSRRKDSRRPESPCPTRISAARIGARHTGTSSPATSRPTRASLRPPS